MPQENKKYDAEANILYDLWKKEDWTHFHHLSRKERDYWRALAESGDCAWLEKMKKDLEV